MLDRASRSFTQLPMVDRIACVQLAGRLRDAEDSADEGAEAGCRRYLLHVEHFSNIQGRVRFGVLSRPVSAVLTSLMVEAGAARHAEH
jgi:hypothetical protein